MFFLTYSWGTIQNLYQDRGIYMNNIRNRIEKWFEDFAHVIYRNRIKTIVLMLVAVAAMVFHIPKIKFDTSTEGFLHDKDPTLQAYNAFRDQFGRDEVIIIDR